MFDLLIEFYVRAFIVLIPALFVANIALNANRAGFTPDRAIKTVTLMGIVFGIWAALAIHAAETGMLMPPETISDIPWIAVFLIGGSLSLVALAFLTETGRAILDATDQRMLIAPQILRIMGGVFVIGWLIGRVPWQFALPAGIGDVLAGLAALSAYRALSRGDSNAAALTRRANIIGLVDFALAVSTGLMTSEGLFHVMSLDHPNIINQYPLAMFPAFFVPSFLALHIFSLRKLAKSDPRAVPA